MKTRNHQVFVSFRHIPVLLKKIHFIEHLYDALQRKGMSMYTYELDLINLLEERNTILWEILEVIDKSRICFVVFSRNYADSTWCLSELTKISEKIIEPGCAIVPIYYDVDPSEVRYQKGSIGRAFAEHEERFASDLLLVQKWRTAMTDVASLAGWDVRNKHESQVIDDIVEYVISKLGHKSSALADDLVGVESRVEALENLLDLDSKDVRFVGICGMGGIGKTTLAAVLHDRYSHLFDACCFLADVSKVSKASGLVRLQKQLLSETLGKELEIWDERQGTNLISTKLGRLKILIVVDDVDDLEQLEKLAGKSVWFGKGSRIIVTTRDKRILRAHDINRVHEVELLNHDEALQLLCRKAFKSDNPLAESKDIIIWAVEYANGLPLAIKALAWVLFGLDESEWSDAMATLKENPLEKVMEVLQTSFDSLEKEEKEIFLDIACFFEGAEENYVMEILDHCGYYPAVGVRVLFDKSLIGIVNGTFKMNKFLQQLGWKIARANSPKDQTNWSRLWLYDDFQHILQTNTMLLNLRSVDLRNSESVTVMPDFSRIPNLERLDLEGCSGLLQLDKSISILPKLKVLNLKKCINLVSIPNSLFGLSSLKFLNLAGCSKLAECLDFDNWRTSVEVKVLSNEDVPLREVLSYNVLSKFPEKVKNNKFVCLLACLYMGVLIAPNRP